MAMQGIDISDHQAGIDLSKVPCDFVIVKATQGTWYVSESCDTQVQQTISLGKLLGFYHYVDGSGAQAEADFFVDNCAGYFGKGIPCIDWEEDSNSAWGDIGYLKRLVQRVIDRTGVKPLIYAQSSAFPWDVAQTLNCGAWVAQYADNNTTGYQDSPWNEGAYGCAIRQYSSHGRLDGYSGNLDIDKAYMPTDGRSMLAQQALNQQAGSKRMASGGIVMLMGLIRLTDGKISTVNGIILILKDGCRLAGFWMTKNGITLLILEPWRLVGSTLMAHGII